MNPHDEKPRLRVSDWGDPTAPPQAAAPAPTPVAPHPPATPQPEKPAASEGMDLPVDPFRLLGGIWQRRRWIVIGAVLGLIALTAIGFLRTETRYQVSAQLIQREVPNSFRAGEIGEAFKPRTLSSATLIGLASSGNVLARVAERSDPPISLGMLRQSTQVAEQRGTDYLYLTISGYTSAQNTVDLANLWSEEVVTYTREMQSRESREIRQYLQQEMDNNQAELEQVGKGLLEFTRREGLVSVDKQIDAQLRAIGDLDLRYETSRLEIDSIDIKLRSLETALARQSPLADKLKEARATLAQVRTSYTDTNPITLDALERVATVEAELIASRAEENTDLSRFAGTFLGNTLYLQILDLRSQRESLQSSLAKLDQLRENARTKLNALPAKELGIAQLTRSRASLENTRDLLQARLREAELFEDRAPGYYQIFSPATIEAVMTTEKLLTVTVYALLGLVMGCGGAFGLALFIELFDSRLRTGAEAAKAWSAPLLATFPHPLPAEQTALDDITARLWSRWLGDTQTSAATRVIWNPQADPLEASLWEGLIKEAQRLLPNLLIVDAGGDAAALPALSALPITTLTRGAGDTNEVQRIAITGDNLSIQAAGELAERLRQFAAQDQPVWLRLVGPVREPLTSLSRLGRAPLIAVPAASATIPHWREQAARFEATVGTPGGVVILGETPWHER
jgi:uncharacterized protein involved in exopolysaccharide biosynthesis